jgi:hypothetical protein
VAEGAESELRADPGPGVPYRALQRLRGQLEGLFEYEAGELPLEELRTWRLCTLLHCRPTQLDEESAVELDWLLAVDDTVARARRNIEKRQTHGHRVG